MQKTRKVKQRKSEAEKKRIKRAQAKKSNSQNAKTDEKRSINDSEVDCLGSACAMYGRKFKINDQ